MILTWGSGQCCTLSQGSPCTALGIQSLTTAGSQATLGKDSVVSQSQGPHLCTAAAAGTGQAGCRAKLPPSRVTAGCLSCQPLPPEPSQPTAHHGSSGSVCREQNPVHDFSFILLLAIIWYEMVTPTSASAPVPGSTDTSN